jgi:6-phospho-3-hexuloisomerase
MRMDQLFETDLQELRLVIAAVDPGEVDTLVDAIVEADRLFVTGLGRSGLVMRMFALRLMQLGQQTFVVGDATTPAIGKGDLLVVGSASGETEGPLLAASQAHRAGAPVAGITAKVRSTLARTADLVVVIPGTTPKSAGRQATSALPLATVLEQAFLIVADCVIAGLAERTGATSSTMMARHANIE